MGVLLAFASAGIAGASSSGPGTKPVAVNISGTGAGSSSADGTTGACNYNNWVDECTGAANCECFTLTSPKISNSKLTVSNIFFTMDKGANPATQSAVNGGPKPECQLVLGTADVTGNGYSITLNFLGTSCRHVIAITSTNPQGDHDKDILSGGWGISDTPASSPTQSGWGTFAGMSVSKTAAVSLRLQGWTSK